MLKNADAGITIIELERLTSLIAKTTTMAIAKTVKAMNDIIAVIKNDFKTFFSLALYASVIEKKMIEINIKNSTITSKTKRLKTQNKENSPIIIVERNNLMVEKKVFEANLIKRETTTQIKPKIISMSAVKNFEFTI